MRGSLPTYSYSPYGGQGWLDAELRRRVAWSGGSGETRAAPGGGDRAEMVRAMKDFERKKKSRDGWPVDELLRTGEILAAHASAHELQVLNVLMKVADILMERGAALDVGERSRAAGIIDVERETLRAYHESRPSIDRSGAAPSVASLNLGRVNGLGMLVSRGARARAYLEALERANVVPAVILLLNDDPAIPAEARERARPAEDEEALLRRVGWRYRTVAADAITDPALSGILRDHAIRRWIYTGGGIVPGEMMEAGLHFLHVHPGRLPDERGSTVLYFTVLERGVMNATAFEMAEELDAGALFRGRRFPVPSHTNWDFEYDPQMRAELMIAALPDFLSGKNAAAPVVNPDRLEYTIIHPILKHMALLQASGEEYSL